MERKSLEVKLADGPQGAFLAVFATLGVVDQDGDVALPGAFPSGKEVLVSAYDHSSWRGALPVGKGVIEERGKEAVLNGLFNLATDIGREHYEAVKFAGHLQQWSYGFRPLEFSTDQNELAMYPGAVRLLKKVDVLEVSPVLQGAGIGTRLVAIKALEEKGAIPPHTTPRADEEAAWDGPRAVAEAPNDARVLRRMHAWVDPEGDPDAKRSYKLPHHLPDGRVVWRGVAAAMAALLGARGGVDIPQADRRGVWEHLARHYRQFDREPPELRSSEHAGLTYADHADQVLADLEAFWHRTKELAALRLKEGRVLSAANRQRLERLLEALEQVSRDLKELLEAAAPAGDGGATTEARRLWAEYVRLKALLVNSTTTM